MKPPAGPEEARLPASDIRAFASSCTMHGLGHVFGPGAPPARRGLWAAAVLLALATFLYQVAGRVHYYGEFHHETALEERESRRLTFPAVTLCNVNPLRRSRLTPNDLHWAGPALLGLEPAEHAAYLRALGRPPAPPGFMPSPTFDVARLYARAGHALEDMLLDCRYRGWPCGPENFTTVSRLCQPPPEPGVLDSRAAPGARDPLPSPHQCLSVQPKKQSFSVPSQLSAGLQRARSHWGHWGPSPRLALGPGLVWGEPAPRELGCAGSVWCAGPGPPTSLPAGRELGLPLPLLPDLKEGNWDLLPFMPVSKETLVLRAVPRACGEGEAWG